MQEVFPTNQELNEMLGTEKYNVWAGVCNLVDFSASINLLYTVFYATT